MKNLATIFLIILSTSALAQGYDEFGDDDLSSDMGNSYISSPPDAYSTAPNFTGGQEEEIEEALPYQPYISDDEMVSGSAPMYSE